MMKNTKVCLTKCNVMYTYNRTIAGHNLYNMFVLTKEYSKNFTTGKLLTIEHMKMMLWLNIFIFNKTLL